MTDNDQVNVISTSSSSCSKWMPFRSSTLQILRPGRYYLHQKPRITPPIPQAALCPPEDQFLLSEVDETERHLLDVTIVQKLVDINREGGIKYVISCKRKVAGANGEILHVIKNEVSGHAQVKMRRDLGDLLAMAYDGILMPLPLAAKEKKQAPLLIDLTEDEESL